MTFNLERFDETCTASPPRTRGESPPYSYSAQPWSLGRSACLGTENLAQHDRGRAASSHVTNMRIQLDPLSGGTCQRRSSLRNGGHRDEHCTRMHSKLSPHLASEGSRALDRRDLPVQLRGELSSGASSPIAGSEPADGRRHFAAICAGTSIPRAAASRSVCVAR